MDKAQLRTLMNFVVETNAANLVEHLTQKLDMDLNSPELKQLLLLMESNTKECFFRVMEKL